MTESIAYLWKVFCRDNDIPINKILVLNNNPMVEREFLYSYDLAEACLFLMSLERTVLDQATKRHGWVVNVGSGHDMTIWELALIIKQTVGYSGEIVKDLSRPDGAQRKLLDSSIVNDLGWKPTKLLSDGLKETYDWYRVKSDRS